jgi:5'-deoxynucleotidase YfbR-like HD superfamily hydrolase
LVVCTPRLRLSVSVALLHDLPEALIGDAMPNERSGTQKAEIETKAMEELLRSLPPKVRSLYREAWREFSAGDTEEARLVRQLDKLEMALQAWEYVKESSGPAVVRVAHSWGYYRFLLPVIEYLSENLGRFHGH